LIDEVFSTGKISYSKVRAMTHVANPENEAFLLQIAEYGTANHLKYLVRKYQRCKRLQDPLEDARWGRHRELAWPRMNRVCTSSHPGREPAQERRRDY
jgi:hypothetical protein